MSAGLQLLDCNLFVGRPVTNAYESYGTAEGLLDAVGLVGIAGGVAWHIAQRDYDPAEGNRLLAVGIDGCEALWGCWTILPPQTQEVITDDIFERMRRHRIVAFRAFPDLHRFQLTNSVFAGFLDELVSRRIPLLLGIEGNIAWHAVYGLLDEVPELTCVLCDIGIAGVDRQTWPLLERYPNVYVESSLLSLGEGAMEAMVGRFGPGRILFGSGFPARYAQSAALQLLHADISDSDKANIAGDNLRRLITEVAL
jgi:hypothetical protein